MKIKLPEPKFEFGDLVLVSYEHTTTIYKDCPECDKGQIFGKTKKFSCPTCHGSGHSYEQIGQTKNTTIDGMLEITGVRIEVNQTPRSFGWDGVMYTGKIVWRTDVGDNQKGNNIFRESILTKID
jgi:hypothetical protein